MKEEWIEVDSEAVQKVRYHRRPKLLDIQFANGKIYAYANATPSELEELLQAESVGAYFNQVFKPSHPNFRKIQG